jgi:hypothetical protein
MSRFALHFPPQGSFGVHHANCAGQVRLPVAGRRCASAAKVAARCAPPSDRFICSHSARRDEGKGKLVDVPRSSMPLHGHSGGANAGHTIYNDEGVSLLCIRAFWHPEHVSYVPGGGVVVHLPGLFEEIEGPEAICGLWTPCCL